ncbi:class I SAM-dependent methyltransferase [Pontibacter sp. BT310]|uniref:Class I SAM-dependent methyltransferase n=1 Tax=Pontibacter populi TaxID=890055 RepID=A0ABS6XAA2_9BACT|nr:MULTISPECIES: class I SAM-dependent methyltransferase [Pontibacter]MBJ6118077.1 class I SAM-dependent methyltransferase [Pontibacter sp. BT310]MBR0570504.1 class I SAM-dependent methyltransferase [Microvirga sp. STS03]MBW3364930.1 class I SAM-dependent methyltransferase [Pontibacter populi]
MSNIKKAYNSWAAQYDTNQNRTRDLEAQAIRETLATIDFERVLEIGCGTGKNTVWLQENATQVTAVDFSEEMLAKAKEKITSEKVEFKQAYITRSWSFVDGKYDLVTFSLVLEHIEHLDHIFEQVADVLSTGGYVYIGELHPFKQYTGSKARFDSDEGRQVLECYTHHISDFTQAAKQHGFIVADINEFFDNNDRSQPPRILTVLLQKV